MCSKIKHKQGWKYVYMLKKKEEDYSMFEDIV